MEKPPDRVPPLYLSQEDKEVILRELKVRTSFTAIGLLIGKSRECVSREVRRGGGVLNYTPTPPSAKVRAQYTYEERKKIEEGCKKGLSFKNIAELVRKSSTGVRKEILKNGGKKAYCAEKAMKNAIARRAEMKKGNRGILTEEEKNKVKEYWENDFSPYQIAAKLGRRPDLVIACLKKENIVSPPPSPFDLQKRIEALEMQVEILYETLKEKL